MKKIISLILALVMVMSLAVTAFADNEGDEGGATPPTGSITISNAAIDETYTVYKVFDASGNGTSISYKLVEGKTSAPAGFSVDAVGNVTYDGTGDELTADDIAAIAAYVTDADKVAETKATSANCVVATGLTNGYYYITTSLGSAVTINSTNPDATVQEKNTVPSVDKTQTLGTTYADADIDANIGDTVHYKIVITDGTGTDKAITMTDTMTDGITYTTGTLTINGNPVADDADTANWKVTVSGRTITIVFKAAYVATVNANNTITVTYDATVNTSAVVDSATDNENEVVMEYSAQRSTDAVYVATYDFQLFKTDGSAYLPNAGFKLYDAETGGNQIKVGKDDTGYYVDANEDEEIMVNSANGVNIRGLAPGTYYLEETTVPNGYNKLASREDVTIETGATAAVVVTVVNNAGSVLPTTGGIGTTLFYVIGGLLMTGAVVLLVTKKRMA